MKIKLLPVLIICAALAYTACIKEGEIQPPPPEPVFIDTVLTYDVTLVYNDGYAPVVQKIDSATICGLFGVTYDDFKTYLTTKKIAYYAITPENKIDETPPTANGHGHWFDANGGVIAWGADAKMYSEFQDVAFAFNIGSHPDNTAAGQLYTFRQGFKYAPDAINTYLAICVFNVSIVP